MAKKTDLKKAIQQPSKKAVEPEKKPKETGSPTVDETTPGSPEDLGGNPQAFSVGAVLRDSKPASRSDYRKKLQARRAERFKLIRGYGNDQETT